ncbi:MAG TPA: heme o synthase [Thermomicrobiaceae bacterium]|nr:heme o synthase [Thermomicrobiaceae bacterium]
MTRFQRLALTTPVLGYLLIVVGGVVRVSGAGLSCGTGWPFCNGALVPALSMATAIGVGHRALAALVTLLSLALLIAAWREGRSRRLLVGLTGLAFVLVVLQAGLGALTVTSRLSPVFATAHFGLAEVYLAVLCAAALVAFGEHLSPLGRSLGIAFTGVGRLGLAAATAVFALLLSGAYVATSGSDLGCSEWPLCGGHLFPTGWTAADIQITHRWAAMIATILVLALAVRARRVRSDAPAVTGLTAAAAVLIVAEIFVGAASSSRLTLAPWVAAAHLAVATVAWVALVLAVTLDRMLPVAATRPAVERAPFRQVSRDYAVLTKPGVMTLLLATTLGAMLLAQAGLPPLRIVVWTLVGGALASGGAAALNHYFDRDIDEIMARTRRRPVPGGRVVPVHAVIFGLTLSVLAVYLLAVFVNPLSAALALFGNLFYVVVYTRWLKRSTPQNIVIGGAAGAVPPLVGWAAVTDHVGVPALILFAIIFYWTPPHFWSLALFRSKTRDYAAAGVPMLPGIYGDAEARRQIYHYSLMLVGVSLFLIPLGVNGPFYLVAALLLGGLFVYKAVRLLRRPENQALLARSLFMYSNVYLGLLFTAMVVDRIAGI